MSALDPNEKTGKRILVLGSAPHTRLVTAYTWDALPEQLNVADYDIVILNLVPFLDKQNSLGSSLDTSLSAEQFGRLFFSEGSEVIAIGVPGVKLASNTTKTVTWWLPHFPGFVPDSGEEIRDIKPEFAYYFKHVNRWSFHATFEIHRHLGDPAYSQRVDPRGNQVYPTMEAIAQTRFDQPIAFELRFKLTGNKLSKKSGRVIWLPPPTEISAHEAVNLILRERYGLLFEQATPTWAEAYKLPNQLPIEEEISQQERKIQGLQSKLIEARQRLQEASRFRKLLYEQGEDVLEPIVRDALRELGARVDDPQQRGREDGRLVDPSGRNGMLEIKGRTGSLRLSDVRQLDNWVRDAIAREDWHSKGILVANLHYSTQLDQRMEPFPDNCIRVARQFGLCLITTTQLFRALCSYQNNELDMGAFWNTIFNTVGPCPLPELEIPDENK